MQRIPYQTDQNNPQVKEYVDAMKRGMANNTTVEDLKEAAKEVKSVMDEQMYKRKESESTTVEEIIKILGKYKVIGDTTFGLGYKEAQSLANELFTSLESIIREDERGKEAGHGYFEVVQDEETGRKYWYGAEDGWKDPEEIGENGVITMDAEAFEVGTIINMREPIEAN